VILNLPLVGLEEAFVRLGIATLAGALIGVNRELRGKPAGMRTHALVALGAALVVYSAVSIARRADGTIDGNVITRAVQGIVAGIGFLGGGVILKTSDRTTVRHLTTAASLWVVACLGIVCGLGQWALGVAALVLTLLMLVIGGPVEGAIRRKIMARLFPKVPMTPSRHTGEVRAIRDSGPAVVPKPHDDD
jgi:putative Mg2+ transporter-C (MgtC) family protein